MSDSNLANFYYQEESSLGTPDAASPMETLGHLRSESLTTDQEISATDEIRGDGTPGPQTRKARSGSGSVETFLAAPSHLDSFLAAVMRDSWSTPISVTGSLTVATTDTFTLTGGFAGFVAGDWFKVDGSASNDGYWRIVTKTSDDEVIVQQTAVNETATASVEISDDGHVVKHSDPS